MSGTIFGASLINGANLFNEDPISNLNNWSKRNLSPDLIIDYDSATRINRFSVTQDNGPTWMCGAGNGFWNANIIDAEVPVVPIDFTFDDSNYHASIVYVVNYILNVLNVEIVKNSDGSYDFTCDPSYIVSDSKTKLGRINGRYYAKKNDGKAIAFIAQYNSTKGLITAPYLISLESWEAVYFTYGKDSYENIDYSDSFTPRLSSVSPTKLVRMWYKVNLKPNTEYAFTMKVQGNFKYIALMVTLDMLSEQKRMSELSSEQKALIVNYDDMHDIGKKSDFGMPFNSRSSPFVYFYIEFEADAGEELVFSNIRVREEYNPSIFYLTGPIDANTELDDDTFNIIAAYPGAWIWPLIDHVSKAHYIFALSGDPFKLIDVASSFKYGYLSTSYRESEPITIEGRTYHKALIKMIDVEYPQIITHVKMKEHTDDRVYTALSKYVTNEEPYNWVKIMDYDKLGIALGVTIGAISESQFPSIFTLTSEELDHIVNHGVQSA